MANILVVEDEERMRDVLKINLCRAGYEVEVAGNGKEALGKLKEKDFQVVITDLKMPGMSGLELLREVKRRYKDTEVIIITAYATAESAVEAMKKGAYDYIIKPFKMEEMKLIIEKIIKSQALREENIRLKQELRGRYQFEGIVAASAQMQEVLERASRLLDVATTVLITGESGTGKELLARAIHYNSPRRDKPFVKVNCAAIPETLLESELFGYEKGAFTGAGERKPGRFELAEGGTIFLDEIGELPLSLQAKLLRVLQEKEFERVGGTETIKVDVRIIAATNRDLLEAVKEKKFREDLFYRLHVVPLHIPPLRERKEDIPLLVDSILKRLQDKFGRSPRKLHPRTLKLLLDYDWPGNVRELENALEYSLLMGEGENILPEHLPLPIREKVLPRPSEEIALPPEGISLEEVEKNLLQKALQISNWNQSRAAKLLGITRRTLIYRMKKFGLKKPV